MRDPIENLLMKLKMTSLTNHLPDTDSKQSIKLICCNAAIR